MNTAQNTGFGDKVINSNSGVGDIPNPEPITGRSGATCPVSINKRVDEMSNPNIPSEHAEVEGTKDESIKDPIDESDTESESNSGFVPRGPISKPTVAPRVRAYATTVNTRQPRPSARLEHPHKLPSSNPSTSSGIATKSAVRTEAKREKRKLWCIFT